MFTNKTIRAVAAGFLLAVFVLAIFPKKYLHDLIANHKDYVSALPNTNSGDELSKAGFNCHIDNLVVECPFVTANISFEISTPLLFPSYFDNGIERVFLSPQFDLQLRGPPSFTI